MNCERNEIETNIWLKRESISFRRTPHGFMRARTGRQAFPSGIRLTPLAGKCPVSSALEGGVPFNGCLPAGRKGHNIEGKYLTGKPRPLGRGASLPEYIQNELELLLQEPFGR